MVNIHGPLDWAPGCVDGDVTEVGRSALNVGGAIPWGMLPGRVKMKNQAEHEHSSLCFLTGDSYLMPGPLLGWTRPAADTGTLPVLTETKEPEQRNGATNIRNKTEINWVGMGGGR